MSKIQKLQKLENKAQLLKQQYLTFSYKKKAQKIFNRNKTKSQEINGINIKCGERLDNLKIFSCTRSLDQLF